MLLSVPKENLEANCSGEIFHFFIKTKLRIFSLGDKEDSLGLLNDFHSRKTVNVVETLVEYHFFLLLWLFPVFSFVWHGSRNGNKKEKNKDQSGGRTMGFEIRELHWNHGPPHPLNLWPIFLCIKCIWLTLPNETAV